MKHLFIILFSLFGFTTFSQSYIKSTVIGNYTLGSCNNSVVIEAYNIPPTATIIEDLNAFPMDTLFAGDTLSNICIDAVSGQNVHRIGFITTNAYTGHAGRLHCTPVTPNFEFNVVSYTEPTGGYYDTLTADGSLTLEFDSAFVLGPNYNLTAFQENGNLTNITYPTANSVTINDASHGWMTLFIENPQVPEDHLDIRFIFGDPDDIYMDTGLVVDLSMQHADNNCVGWVNATPVNATGNLNNNWNTGDYSTNTLVGLCPGVYGVYSYETDVQTAELVGASIDTFIVTNSNTAYIDSSIYLYAAQDTAYYNFQECLGFDFTAAVDTLTYSEDTVFQGGGITIIAFEMSVYQDSNFVTLIDTLTLLNDSLIHLDVAIWCDSTLGSNKANSFNGRRIVFLRGVDEHTFSQGTANTPELQEPLAGFYPNPASESITIYTEYLDDAEVRIMDLNGAILKSENMQSGELQLSVRELPSGMYLIDVMSNDWRSRMKFLKL
ncbi:MAG: T9SS type A sorting domain-containing protein [bacterium]|nr:T9SS type A sorting domain-containing protein [bacterium]